MSKETRKAELMARAKEIMEATLGGAKYKGKDNPNNEKKRNPGSLIKKWNNASRADDAIEKHTTLAMDAAKTANGVDKKKDRHLDAVAAASRVNPRYT